MAAILSLLKLQSALEPALQQSLRISLAALGTAALSIASLPGVSAKAAELAQGSAADLGDVMSVSLKDVVKPQVGLQGALQGAGTPNQAGVGGFLPLSVGDNSVWFLDALVNAPSVTEMATAASSTPMLRVASPPPPAWVTAG